MADRQRIEAFFEGQVQGVGFRARVSRFAAAHHVDGWVANLPDGRVQLVAEGTKGELQQLIEAIREAFDGFIRRDTVDWQPARGETAGFRVRH